MFKILTLLALIISSLIPFFSGCGADEDESLTSLYIPISFAPSVSSALAQGTYSARARITLVAFQSDGNVSETDGVNFTVGVYDIWGRLNLIEHFRTDYRDVLMLGCRAVWFACTENNEYNREGERCSKF